MLTVKVEARPGLAADSAAAKKAAQTLAHEIKTYIGSSADIEVLGEGGVERSMGKAKRVVDLR